MITSWRLSSTALRSSRELHPDLPFRTGAPDRAVEPVALEQQTRVLEPILADLAGSPGSGDEVGDGAGERLVVVGQVSER